MKSGNHTRAPQWIYCGIHMIFYIIPNPFVFKMGIGGSWMDRTDRIGKSMKLPGFILPFFLVWVPFAYQIEKVDAPTNEVSERPIFWERENGMVFRSGNSVRNPRHGGSIHRVGWFLGSFGILCH
jgi:hypothetical protein